MSVHRLKRHEKLLLVQILFTIITNHIFHVGYLRLIISPRQGQLILIQRKLFFRLIFSSVCLIVLVCLEAHIF